MEERERGGGYHQTAKRRRREEEEKEKKEEQEEKKEEEKKEKEEKDEKEEKEEEEEKEEKKEKEEEEEEEEKKERSEGGKADDVFAASNVSGDEDRHLLPPSPVVHVRGLGEAVVEADLVEALQKFGNICCVLMLPSRRQALVEFSGVAAAGLCVAAGPAVSVAGRGVLFNFSSSQEIRKPRDRNPVLLLSIHNPRYPVTTDVLHAVCNSVGNVLRIVIFKRSGVQAMVEFESVEEAQKAKMVLNGANIYSDCCTLKIEYARPNTLNVVRNDSNSWDYTKTSERRKGRHRGILGDHPSNSPAPRCPLLSYRRSSEEVQVSSFSSSCVAMVTGLHPTKMNCERVFNLFCLYGNVVKVSFLRSVCGAALVEMADAFSVERLITHLNNITAFTHTLHIRVSRQQQVFPVCVFRLQEGSSSFQDFSLSRNQRFSRAAHRNTITAPGRILHFYNSPHTHTQQRITQLCKDHNSPTFTGIKLFTSKPSSKSQSGLLQFGSKDEAVEALIVLNHLQIRTPGSSPCFTLKLCFSTASHL